MDYGISFMGILIALPLFIVTGIAIKITSSGPVFYTQLRVGKDGRLFSIIKFRTMRADAEFQTDPVWTKKNGSRMTTMGRFLRETMLADADAEFQTDPELTKKSGSRLTIIGRFLRETYIDELPLLINVLKGDMGIIGPRPERPHIVDVLSDEVPGYANRLAVKPGITGIAQCYCKDGGAVSDVKMKFRYDILYVENRCWMLDMEIIWRTLSIGLLGGKHQIPGKLFTQD